MGIGAAIATTLASHGAQLALFARSEDKLEELGKHIVRKAPATKTVTQAVDIQDYEAVKQAVDDVMKAMGKIDVLINNVPPRTSTRPASPSARPPPFHALPTSQIDQNHLTNTSGVLYTTHAVPNASTMPRNSGTVLNMSSTTAPEAPPFPGEVVYHASKAWLEGFSNALRNELVATDVRVLVRRPGVAATHFPSPEGRLRRRHVRRLRAALRVRTRLHAPVRAPLGLTGRQPAGSAERRRRGGVPADAAAAHLGHGVGCRAGRQDAPVPSDRGARGKRRAE
ncbi:hypothetical protein LTR16_001786 [Cryomyces antarcticus]|uniref:Uncharacterized protein n=1 Tax=Cryomyces antarcticus TaxID=329879 RepID=A0ABR0KVK2_9PEZI|nr:hypothetical protein LTR16_001786 [Cryomyces antarcticus]